MLGTVVKSFPNSRSGEAVSFKWCAVIVGEAFGKSDVSCARYVAAKMEIPKDDFDAVVVSARGLLPTNRNRLDGVHQTTSLIVPFSYTTAK